MSELSSSIIISKYLGELVGVGTVTLLTRWLPKSAMYTLPSWRAHKYRVNIEVINNPTTVGLPDESIPTAPGVLNVALVASPPSPL